MFPHIPRLCSSLMLSLIMFANAACSTMPLHDYLVATPTIDPVASEAFRQAQQESEMQLIPLAINTSDWHVHLLIGEFGIAELHASEMLRISKNLSLSLTESDFATVTSNGTLLHLINGLADSIEEQYGLNKRNEFLLEYVSWLAIFIIEVDTSTLDEESIQILREIASQQLYSGSLIAARLNVPRELQEQGQLLAQEVLNNSGKTDINEDIRSWEKAITFAARGEPTPIPTPTLANPAGQDISAPLPPGNVLRGEILHTEQGCYTCHILAPIGPQWREEDSVKTNPLRVRFQENWQSEEYVGNAETLVQYVVESILHPQVFEGEYPSMLMPQTYGEKMSRQDLADIVAFLMQIE